MLRSVPNCTTDTKTSPVKYIPTFQSAVCSENFQQQDSCETKCETRGVKREVTPDSNTELFSVLQKTHVKREPNGEVMDVDTKDVKIKQELLDTGIAERCKATPVVTEIPSINDSSGHTIENQKEVLVETITKSEREKLENYVSHRGTVEETTMEPFSCCFCEYVAGNRYHLASHMRVHTGEKPFACDICHYRCAHKSSLTVHIKKHLGEFSKITSTTKKGQGPIPCCFCKYIAQKKSRLRKHMKIHTGERLFPCDVCDYRATNSRCLTLHMRRHTVEKTYICKKCDFKTAIKADLTSHKKSHTRDKRFACHKCDFKTARKRNLVKHMVRHTRELSFACQMCDFRTTHKNSLSTHMASHQGVKTWACEQCDYISIYNSNLIAHVKRMHPGKP